MRAWVLLVRHGSAGSRRKWQGPDHLRPLDKKGRRQAESLASTLQDGLELPTSQIGRVLSSPYARCVETVEPLARTIGTEVRQDAALAEGQDEAAADLFWSAVRQSPSGSAGSTALCTHGDIVPFLLDLVADSGLDLGPSPRYPKGSVWALEVREGSLVSARYLPPVA